MNHDEQTLFSQSAAEAERPLADRMRPKQFSEVVGQPHFLNQSFQQMVDADRWTGLLFWGPPGTGKTTLARIIADKTQRPFAARSAVTNGVKEFRQVLEASKNSLGMGQRAHILFIDEVHRLSKAQQDILLPFLEEGSIRFIGATTENPSFEINNAIISRSLIFHLEPIGQAELMEILVRASKQLGNIGQEVLERIAEVSGGDARRALTLLEHIQLASKSKKPTLEDFERLCQSQSLYYDKKSENHYDTISAFIKSVRGSDPDAALYYLARMLDGGEDPLFIARRLIILASEDIGNASPLGLVLATNGFQAVHAIGMPEARIILSQVTTYLACSEKSNRSYKAIDAALDKVKQTGALQVPAALRNAVTSSMKDWGYGSGYKYAHDFEGAWAKMDFLPDEINNVRFYYPSERGTEKRFQEFLKYRGKTD